ncbi:MAG: hypothetical protein IPK19_16060 [Chloroflexi bacterium]|nr:hypothetical protein [Chloroflexota bacterium]
MDTTDYEIRVERHLSSTIAALFPELTLKDEEGSTVMRGALPDQAALHGVLARIRDLNLTLISITRLDER